jgi:hypothetical protein
MDFIMALMCQYLDVISFVVRLVSYILMSKFHPYNHDISFLLMHLFSVAPRSTALAPAPPHVNHTLALALQSHCSIPKIQILKFSQTRSKFKINFKFHFQNVCLQVDINK